MSEPIRLVCPECDTVHRVKKVTLGKLYRCKKCKAPLITMSPAIIQCGQCGHAYPPAHVDVSRLITCDRCEDEPLMDLEFPPPVRPVREVRVDAEAETEDNAPGEVMGPMQEEQADAPASEADADPEAPGEPETPGFDEAVTAPPPAAAEVHASSPVDAPPPPPTSLAMPGQEDRAIAALRQVMEDVQAPLVREIERARGTVPVWALMMVSLPLIVLLGWLVNSYVRTGALETDMVRLQQDRDLMRERAEGLDIELRQARQEREALRVEMESLKAKLKNEAAMNVALKRLLNRQHSSLKEYQAAVEKRDELIRSLRQQIRELGYEPEAVSLAPAREATP